MAICKTCGNWADARPFWVTHHKDCKHYNPIKDATELITRLVRGMEAWASDEDGVHYEAWDAYRDAKMGIGEPVSPHEQA